MTTRSKTMNRLLSLVLCLCMVLALMPAIPLTADAATATKIYLKPNSEWKQAGARFAAYFFGNGEKWVSMTDSNGDGIYECDVPSGYTQVIFCRMNPSTSTNDWDSGNKWNQTADLNVPTDNKILFTVAAGYWDNASTTWSTPSCDDVGHHFSNNICDYCKKGVCQINGHTFKNDVCTICSTAGRTVYFQNNWLWSDIQLYYWNTEGNNGWPGEPMTLYGKAKAGSETNFDYYVMTIPVDCTDFIINGVPNDGSADRVQTVSISNTTWKDGFTYYIAGFDTAGDCTVESFAICMDFAEEHNFVNNICTRCEGTYCDYNGHDFVNNVCSRCELLKCHYAGHNFGEDGTCTACGIGQIWIFFENNWNWSDIHLYYWYQEEDMNNGWPGEKMSAYKSVQTGSGTTSYYRLQVPADVADIIINGTDANKPEEEQAQQTPNISTDQLYNGVTFKMLWVDGEGNQIETYHINEKFQCAAGHTEKAVAGYDVTCTEDGLTDGIVCDVCKETLKKQEVISAPGHIDSDEDGRCNGCNIPMEPARLMKASVSLKGNIAVNYYMLLTQEVYEDPTAYIQFTLSDGEIRKIPASQGVELDGYYVYTCAVNAKEMTDVILSQFFYAGGATREHTYNVKTYAKHILENYDDEATKNLMAAMVNYGAASQAHFGYNTGDMANTDLVEVPDYSNVTIQGFNTVGGQGTDKAKFYSASLILKSETTVRFFFTGKITATYKGQELEVHQRSGRYYVDVVGISAKDLDENVTITINDGTTTADVSFNPMSYCQGVWNDTTGAFDADLKNLVCALYLYNQAANAYFER